MAASAPSPAEPPLRTLLLNPISFAKITKLLASKLSKGSVFLVDGASSTWMDATLAGAVAALTEGLVLCVARPLAL